MNNSPSYTDPEVEVERLQKVIAGLEETSKMLVRRDIDLRRAYEQLKSLDIEKTEFVSIAAHQLRTPVTTARWALSYILTDKAENLNAKQLQLLERAERSIEHTHELVEELLELNRLDFGGVEMNLVPGNIQKLCADILNDHQPSIRKKNIQLTREFPEQAREVHFDRHRLRDAIDNLVDNAIKYSKKDASLDMSVQYSEKNVSVRVADTGIGVDKGQDGKIFNKFSRLENAQRIDPNGIGLGLYISRKIVEKHGGTLTFAHNSPQGSIFTITIPRESEV